MVNAQYHRVGSTPSSDGHPEGMFICRWGNRPHEGGKREPKRHRHGVRATASLFDRLHDIRRRSALASQDISLAALTFVGLGLAAELFARPVGVDIAEGEVFVLLVLLLHAKPDLRERVPGGGGVAFSRPCFRESSFILKT